MWVRCAMCMKDVCHVQRSECVSNTACPYPISEEVWVLLYGSNDSTWGSVLPIGESHPGKEASG